MFPESKKVYFEEKKSFEYMLYTYFLFLFRVQLKIKRRKKGKKRRFFIGILLVSFVIA